MAMFKQSKLKTIGQKIKLSKKLLNYGLFLKEKQKTDYNQQQKPKSLK